MRALNILLVDDNRSLLATLSEGLRKALGAAASVAVCVSGSEALSMLTTQSFDVVISEFNLPGESGLQLLNKIRQDYPETILVLATTYGTDALEKQVHRLRIGYLTKPFEILLLVQIIHELVGDAETATEKDETESAPHILIPDSKKSNADML